MLEQFLKRFVFKEGPFSGRGSNPAFNKEDWGPLTLWRFNVAPEGVSICFTARRGGYSGPPYDSLNLGFHVGDDQDLVQQNRSLLCNVLGIDAKKLTSPRQRHTAEVAMVGLDHVGAGADSEESYFDPCDGLLTDLAEVPLLLHYADCVPVVLAAANQENAAVGVLHAGRQGLVDGVVKNGVELFRSTMGVDQAAITVAIGPHIRSCCYEVSEEIAAQFAERFDDSLAVDNYLDLANAVVSDLVSSAVDNNNIHILDICTSCDKDFYSYRRDGVTGRHGAIAWIES